MISKPTDTSKPLKKKNHETFCKRIAMGDEPAAAWGTCVHVSSLEERARESAKLLASPTIQARVAAIVKEAALPGCPLPKFPKKEKMSKGRKTSEKKALSKAVELPEKKQPGSVDELCESLWWSFNDPVHPLPHRIKAAELLARLRGWYAPDRRELDVNVHAVDLIKKIEQVDDVELLPMIED